MVLKEKIVFSENREIVKTRSGPLSSCHGTRGYSTVAHLSLLLEYNLEKHKSCSTDFCSAFSAIARNCILLGFRLTKRNYWLLSNVQFGSGQNSTKT